MGRGRMGRCITPLSGHEELFSLARVLVLFVVLGWNKRRGNEGIIEIFKASFNTRLWVIDWTE